MGENTPEEAPRELKAASVEADLSCVEVTPEMIAAGQRCLNDLFDRAVPVSYENLDYIPEGWAEAVYRAMQKQKMECSVPAKSVPQSASGEVGCS